MTRPRKAEKPTRPHREARVASANSPSKSTLDRPDGYFTGPETDPAVSFPSRLASYLGQLTHRRQSQASEDTIRADFLTFLRDAFPKLQQGELFTLEKHIPAFRVRGGFADALYADLIFEFKREIDEASRADGLEKLARYLNNQEHCERYLGILTDGLSLEVYSFNNEESLDKIDELKIDISEHINVRAWLDCYLFHDKKLVPTTNDVLLRFGERSPSFWHSMRIMTQLWKQIGHDPSVQTKFAEWQGLLSIVYGSEVGEEVLFLRHTYLAMFARLLAFLALHRKAPTDDEIAGLATGKTFTEMGFDNFAENDFFCWVGDQKVVRETQTLLRAIATRLASSYDLRTIQEDLLKGLYQGLVDPKTRQYLGEFYTPDWLAELTLRHADYPPQGELSTTTASLLDPACGSGTFLFTAIRLLRASGLRGKALVDHCQDSLVGVDVHPLAVTIAKTNFLLALGDDIRGYRKGITLPIYMADSMTLAESALDKKIVRVYVDTATIAEKVGKRRPASLPPSFELPLDLAGQPRLLNNVVEILLQFADPELELAEAQDGFCNRLIQLGIAKQDHYLWRTNLTLMRWLLSPPATDSVWRFVLRNACQPLLLASRKFHYVVGNPPWLSYHKIEYASYKERLKIIAGRYGLLEGKSALSLLGRAELATIFFVFCDDHYLADGRTLAFVMPRSIMTGAKHHVLFQQLYLAKAKFLIDCQKVNPLFRIPSCVVIWQKSIDSQDSPYEQGSCS